MIFDIFFQCNDTFWRLNLCWGLENDLQDFFQHRDTEKHRVSQRNRGIWRHLWQIVSVRGWHLFCWL